MKATRRPIIAIAEAGRHRFWRWPLAFALALAVAVSLFHDLPALAGGGGSDSILVAAASSTSTPVQAPDSQAPVGCHCLCHMAAQAMAAPIVTAIVFGDSFSPPCNAAPTRSWAGLPPFRPPRI
jgi:hypothetical protein